MTCRLRHEADSCEESFQNIRTGDSRHRRYRRGLLFIAKALRDSAKQLHGTILAGGWHWCCEFDLILVGPDMSESRCCQCPPKDHPAYKTIPPGPGRFYSGQAF